MWHVVTYHTPGEYAKVCQNLIESLKRHQISYTVFERPALGSWLQNVNQKPGVILNAMLTIPYDIVWLDADSVVKRFPALFDTIKTDIAVCQRPNLVASGTIFLKNTETVKNFVYDWCRAVDLVRQRNDQDALRDTLTTHPEITQTTLPWSYCAIADFYKEEPVIAQNQASRTLRHARNP